MQQLSEKPVLFNKKLLPLIKRYFTFSGNPIFMFVFWSLFISSSILAAANTYLGAVFFFFMLFSNLVASGIYGINENQIISHLPVSKRQSILVRCFHLVTIQLLSFAVMIALAHIINISDGTGLYAKNKYLGIAVLIVSVTILNPIIIRLNMRSLAKAIKLSKALLGLIGVIIFPALAPLLLNSDYAPIANFASNTSLGVIILSCSIVLFLLVTIRSCMTAVNLCDAGEVAVINNANNPSPASLDLTSKPDGMILTLYLKLLRLFRLNENTVRLVRKDFRLGYPPALFIACAVMFALSYIPALSWLMFFLYPVPLLTIVAYIFVPNGDIKASFLMPIKRSDYIRSKLVLCVTLQLCSIILLFLTSIVTYQFGFTPMLIDGAFSFACFAGLFVSLATSNLIYFGLVFKHPYKKRTISLPMIAFFMLVIFMAIVTEIPQSFSEQLLTVLVGFAFYALSVPLTWLISKNKKADM